MCGLTGVVNLDGSPASPVVVQSMTDALAHRGPDGEGIYTVDAYGVGHRRLAIIDLTAAGHQPMATADGRYVLAYNGEVYNFRELRLTLEALGHQFRSRTDAEVVLEAFSEWGIDAVHKFNGMFAFALWDNHERRLWLARDRYGIKPLYFARRGDALLFGSEVKALLAHPALRTTLDVEGLVEYLTFQNFFTDHTLFEGVHLLPAGSWMRWQVGDRTTPTPHRYWEFDFTETGDTADGDAVEELDRLFQQAVNRQLVADVPVSAYLSGGMDSGSITAVAAPQVPLLRTFTVGFDLHSASGIEIGFDERSSAELMSYEFKTEHYEMVLKAGDMERAMRRLVWHLEEPRVGQSYPNYYAAQLASRFGKVVLSGCGGDELFGGYPWRYYRAVVNSDFDDYIEKYYGFWQRLIPDADTARLFGPVWDRAKAVDTHAIMAQVFADRGSVPASPEDYINHSLTFEAKTFLHGLLVVEDKLSMAHSLETRVPFLDNDLVDFATALPVRTKLGNLGEVVRINENDSGPKPDRYYQRTNDGKLVLRRAMERHVPAAVIDAAKQGFSAPDASWFRGESIDYVRRTLMERDALLFDIVDRDTVQSLVRDHLDGRRNRRLLVWSLLWLEEWCRVFLEGAPVDRDPLR